jgi:antitoxin (DNA-binding transcriptional repressor) of toxin-antitoxin stability system
MKTMSVRDIRQRWPEAERALRHEGEILVTRDARPVARLLPLADLPMRALRRLDLSELRRWRQRFWRHQPPQPPTGEWLDRDRAD